MPRKRAPKVESVTVLANSTCAHCVHALDVLTEWAIEEGIAVAGLDLVAHPDAAEWANAETSPILVFEGTEERIFAGMPSHDDFHRLVTGR
jgi:glutaredoxin